MGLSLPIPDCPYSSFPYGLQSTPSHIISVWALFPPPLAIFYFCPSVMPTPSPGNVSAPFLCAGGRVGPYVKGAAHVSRNSQNSPGLLTGLWGMGGRLKYGHLGDLQEQADRI